MKTHPITDHVPEAELLEITRDGAARWLLRHGWEWDGACMVTGAAAVPWVVMPIEGTGYRNQREAEVVQKVAAHHRKGAGEVIAEMQADSRIVAELARMSAARGVSKSETSGSATIERGCGSSP